MRVVRAAGQNVSPSDDGRLFDQIFSDGLFTDTTFTNLGGNSVQIGAMYGDLCGRDFTVEQMTLTVTLPEGEGEVTGYIYVEIDTSSDDVITLNSALAPFTPTYEDINTNGAIAQMILAEYTATAVAVTGVTPVFKKVAAGAVRAGSVATVETAQATQNHSVGEYILLDKQLYIVTAAVSAGETFVEGTNISATSIGGELKALNNGLTQLGKIYRFNVSSGAVAINARMPFVKSYSLDDSIYADGTSIKFTRSGIVRIDLNVNAQTGNRLWLTIHGNVNHQFITYGTYVTCNSSIVVQVDTSYEFYITAKEACTVNGGGTDPSTIFFTWMS